MILSHEFTVEGDIGTVWRTLLDLERVAGCLPGATIRASGEEGRFEGSMKVKMGPMSVTYEGSASLVEVDDVAHRAVISLRAREARGQGTALATITNRVEQVGGAVRVHAETDLQVTGPQARFGRAIMEDVGNRVLGEFAVRLEREIAAQGPRLDAGDGEPVAAPPPPLPPVEDAFDMGAAIAQTSAVRNAKRALPVALAGLIVWFVLRRRR